MWATEAGLQIQLAEEMLSNSLRRFGLGWLSNHAAVHFRRCIDAWLAPRVPLVEHALSSGEAELIAITKGDVTATGMKNMAKDLGIDFEITVTSDSKAVRSMA